MRDTSARSRRSAGRKAAVRRRVNRPRQTDRAVSRFPAARYGQVPLRSPSTYSCLPTTENPMPAPAKATIASVLDHVDANLAASRAILFDLLRIRSISAQPAHAPDCVKAAEWWRDQLTGLGFEASVRPTAGHPVVVGHLDGPAGYNGPHILFYG